jgi:putative membrane protein
VKTLSYVLALLGLLLATVLIAWFNVGRVAAGALSVGLGGFALLIAWQLLIFLILGLAWDVLTQSGPNRTLWVFVWGRMVRDSSANCLPFSQVGAFIFGARAVTLLGIPWPTAAATTVVDVTAEFLAQLTVTAIGVVILLIKVPDSTLARPLEIGLFLAVAAAIGFIVVQRGAAPLFSRISGRIAARRLDAARDRLEAVQREMTALYRQPLRLALSWAVHLTGWIGTGVAGWLAYRLLNVPLDLASALAIEALLSALAALAFLVPVNAGVQEAGYAGLGAIFGIPPEISLSVSLIRRARDLVIGVPVLLIWQFAEFRRVRPVSAPKEPRPEEPRPAGE